MVVIDKKARRIHFPTDRQVERRQAHIRAGWSPSERRERARQATAQMGLLWALIQSPPQAAQ